jgi:hypothetical protein
VHGAISIRNAEDRDDADIWRILEPIIRDGCTYTLPPDMSEQESLRHWRAPGHEVFVAESAGEILGTNLGVGWTLCISPGPHQYVFHSNSNPNGNRPGSWDITGEIYKTELDGTVLGKFGRPGKVAPGFQVVHMMDCRNPTEIILGEIESWRVQKFILQQAPVRSTAQR